MLKILKEYYMKLKYINNLRYAEDTVSDSRTWKHSASLFPNMIHGKVTSNNYSFMNVLFFICLEEFSAELYIISFWWYFSYLSKFHIYISLCGLETYQNSSQMDVQYCDASLSLQQVYKWSKKFLKQPKFWIWLFSSRSCTPNSEISVHCRI